MNGKTQALPVSGPLTVVQPVGGGGGGGGAAVVVAGGGDEVRGHSTEPVVDFIQSRTSV